MKGYKKYKDWYRNTRSILMKQYGSDYKLVAALISATSPKRHVKQNIRIAISLYNDFKKNPNDLLNLIENNPSKFKRKYELMNCHVNNVINALNHNFKKTFELSGDKVNAFYNNIIGNYDYVTLDVWMLKFFEIEKDKLNKTEYKELSNVVTLLAEAENMLPAEYQAMAWTKVKAEFGFRPIGFAQFLRAA